jgi:hypothetical protein
VVLVSASQLSGEFETASASKSSSTAGAEQAACKMSFNPESSKEDIVLSRIENLVGRSILRCSNDRVEASRQDVGVSKESKPRCQHSDLSTWYNDALVEEATPPSKAITPSKLMDTIPFSGAINMVPTTKLPSTTHHCRRREPVHDHREPDYGHCVTEQPKPITSIAFVEIPNDIRLTQVIIYPSLTVPKGV